MAVLGKDMLSAKEIRNMTISERVVNGYRLMMSEKYKSDWAKFAKDYPKEKNILDVALMCWENEYGK